MMTAIKETFFLKKRNYLQALDNINLTIDKGEIIGVLGPNGAGKTTLLKVIAGFLLPEEGHVSVNGYDIIKHRQKVRRSVNFLRSGGWIIFDYKYPVHKLLEFWGVMMGLTRKEARQNIDKVLDTVGLLDKKEEYAEHLSAGLLQRLNLARCLMTPRPVYLLDEPTVNMDPYSANYIREFVKKDLVKRDSTIVLATHNLWEAEDMCDRIVILNKGKIIKIGTPQEIRKGIARQMVLVESDSAPKDLLAELENLPYVSGVRFDNQNKIEVYGDDLRQKVIEIEDTCRKYTTVTFIHWTAPNLHEIFLKIIEEDNS